VTPELRARLEKARARPSRKDVERPTREIDWADVGKSALTGTRSGLESTVGSVGDIGDLQGRGTSYVARKLGLSPEAAELVATYTNPLSMFPSTEDVSGLTDALFGRDDYTRHEATSPQGKNIQTGAEFASGLVGGPENFGKDVALKLGMSLIPAVKAGTKIAEKVGAKVGREALAEAAPKIGQKVDATIGDLNNPSVIFEGLSPHDFADTEQWHRFGQQYGVPNLGSASKADWEAGLVPHQTSTGDMFTIPGGADSTEPFTYYDLLHIKSQGINPNDIPPELHQSIHDRITKTMSPEGPVSPERMMNQLSLGQISPNQPLSPNELAVARTMVKGPEDLKKLGEMVPWRHSDDPATSGARDVVSSKPAIDKKTGEPKLLKSGEPKMIDTTRRDELSSQIANQLGLGAGSQGGLGARGTADYTRIAESAQRMAEDPEFFRFRGAGEGGHPDPHHASNWSNYVERLMNQTPGLSSKTGSFSGVWQNPAKANISAVDRHMAGKFTEDMFPSHEDYEGFKQATVEKYLANNPGAGPIRFEALPQAAKNDALFGYLNKAPPPTKMRLKPEPGSNSGVGAVNPDVPLHLQPDQARWVHEPQQVERISEPYQRVLEANADVANEAGQGTFASQWMLWDRIRNRLEPHEIMFPGLEKIPRMSMEQMHAANQTLKDAGYMSSSKEIDALTGEKKLTPVRRMPSASKASYFTLPVATVGGGAMMLDALKDRERDKKKPRREES
jgi:hypothetical protein